MMAGASAAALVAAFSASSYAPIVVLVGALGVHTVLVSRIKFTFLDGDIVVVNRFRTTRIPCQSAVDVCLVSNFRARVLANKGVPCLAIRVRVPGTRQEIFSTVRVEGSMGLRRKDRRAVIAAMKFGGFRCGDFAKFEAGELSYSRPSVHGKG